MSTHDARLRDADLTSLVAILKDQNARKHDIVVPAQSIHAAVTPDGTDYVLYVEDAEPVGVEADGTIVTDFLKVAPGVVMDDGIATRLDIPRGYFRRMRAEAPQLLCDNINEWLGRSDALHMIRAFSRDDGEAAFGRAFLSDRFGCIDNFDIVLGVLDGVRAAAPDATVSGCDLTEKHMRLRVEAPSISLNVADILGDYQVYGKRAADFPLMWAGIGVTNSEVGAGAYTLAPMAVVEVCKNGMTRPVDAMRRVHLGSRMEEGIVNWSDDTRRAQVDLIRAQARDAVSTFLNVDYLSKFRADMERAAGLPVNNLRQAVQHIASALAYTEQDADAILSHFVAGHDTSALGLAQAVTLHAQSPDDSEAASDAMGQALDLAVAAAAMSEVDWVNALSAAEVLRDAAADIDHTLGQGSPGEVTISEVVRVMLAIGGAQTILAHAYDALHAITNELMEDNEQVVPGVARLERGWKRSRSNWEHDALRRDALTAMRNALPAHAVDPETGEAVHTWDQAVSALGQLFNLAGYNARVTKVRDLGPDVGDYSTQGPWQPKISVQPEAEEPDDE